MPEVTEAQVGPPTHTLEQSRARFALQCIDAVRDDPSRAKSKGKYKTQLLKLPARLHSNGLGQTVAFYLTAGPQAPEWEICGWLENWLRERRIYTENGDLIHNITRHVEARYREASNEARALSVWLKRFAEAFLIEEGAAADGGKGA